MSIRHFVLASASALAFAAITLPATPTTAQEVNRTAAHAQVQRPISFVTVSVAPAGGTLVLPLANADALANAPGLDDAARAAITQRRRGADAGHRHCPRAPE
jgi:hypothetical protein